eukprot:TRINITY_DN61203_c0_g1_i1.p1 TRINITY_DN61203_c0_g1~~TRINITY_DN61203_c0_g1_i1.p1  ORF type:complete len:387 (+),score=44.66 TRINITY_DN61203_c0_g1_i1:24-1163(+)
MPAGAVRLGLSVLFTRGKNVTKFNNLWRQFMLTKTQLFEEFKQYPVQNETKWDGFMWGWGSRMMAEFEATDYVRLWNGVCLTLTPVMENADGTRITIQPMLDIAPPTFFYNIADTYPDYTHILTDDVCPPVDWQDANAIAAAHNTNSNNEKLRALELKYHSGFKNCFTQQSLDYRHPLVASEGVVMLTMADVLAQPGFEAPPALRKQMENVTNANKTSDAAFRWRFNFYDHVTYEQDDYLADGVWELLSNQEEFQGANILITWSQEHMTALENKLFEKGFTRIAVDQVPVTDCCYVAYRWIWHYAAQQIGRGWSKIFILLAVIGCFVYSAYKLTAAHDIPHAVVQGTDRLDMDEWRTEVGAIIRNPLLIRSADKQSSKF